MVSNRKRNRNRKRNQSNRSSQALTIPNSLPNSSRATFTTSVLFTGGNVTPATTTGYSYLTITSGLWNSSSPWTQLAALYQFVKPRRCRIEVTFNRATGNSDNPRVTFVPTPSGNAVGSLGMNLSTFESALGVSKTGGPGQILSYSYKPFVLIAVYNTVSNGYMSATPGVLSLANLPLVYFGDLLIYTPGILLSSVTNYISIKLMFDFEFSVLTAATQ